MNDERFLVGSFGEDLDGNLRVMRIESDVRTLGGVAGETAQRLRSTERGDVFVEYGIRRDFRIGRNLDLVGIFERCAVLNNKAWNNLRLQIAAMTRITRDGADSLEVVLVEGVHHLNHAARRLLHRSVGRKTFPALIRVR